MAVDTVSLHAFYKSEGEGVDAFLSRPAGPGPWPAIMTVHEMWGLDEHARDITRRLALEGFVALAPDLFHGRVPTDFEEAHRQRAALDVERAVKEISAGIPYLRGLPFTSGKVGVMGFCMGGGLTLLAACNSREFSAAVSYYPTTHPDAGILANLACPLLIHHGTADAVTPRSEIERIKRDLEQNNKSCELYFYEEAGHAFMSEGRQVYHKEAAETSWPRTLEFLHRHLAGQAAGSQP